MAADQWHLGDHALHSTIDCTQHQDMATTVTRTPNSDPVWRRLAERLSEGYGIAVITHLLPWVDLLPNVAIARAEIAIIKDQRRQSMTRKFFRELVEKHLLDRRKAV